MLPFLFLIPSTPGFSPRLHVEEGAGSSWLGARGTRVDDSGRAQASPHCVALSPCMRAGDLGLPGPQFPPVVLWAAE